MIGERVKRVEDPALLRGTVEAIGAFLAVWIIGYGTVQSLAPRLLSGFRGTPQAAASFLLPMAAVAFVISIAAWTDSLKALITVVGLLAFGVMFALTSSVHSYLILAYSVGDDEVAMDVGYYYSANAAGRFVGTFLSGVLYLWGGLEAAMWGSAVFVAITWLLARRLPPLESPSAENADASAQ